VRREVPVELRTDLTHGGRWTSLRSGSREWCWANADAATRENRLRVSPGDAFVDAGGVEECFPTVRGVPDHGDAWTRAWRGSSSQAEVAVPGFDRLARQIHHGRRTEITYRVSGEPGERFLHAVHALLQVSPDARLEVPEARRMTVLDVADPERTWPSGLDRLGPDDGTAVCALVVSCHEATVVDGDQALRFRWSSPDRPELCSLLLWRNLGGWPEGRPYRSIGIEPMVGRAADLAAADPSRCATLGPTGTFTWTVEVSAWGL
jgi:hypothetical protein